MKDQSEKKNGTLAWLAWSSAALFYLYVYFVRVAPSIMEQEITHEFSASATIFSVVIGLYYVVYAFLQLCAGILLDKLGGRAVLLPSIFLIIAGCFVSIIPSDSILFLTVGRLLTGAGSSCAFIGVMYIAAVWFHENRLALLSGLTTSLGILGAILGQGPLSMLVKSEGWRMTWLWIGVLGTLVAFFLLACIPPSPKWEKQKRTEIASQLSFKNFIKGFMAVIRNPQTWFIGAVAGCLYMPLEVFGELWGIQYVKSTLAKTATQASVVVAMLYLGWLVGSPISGYLSDRVRSRKKLLVISSLLSTLALGIMVAFPWQSGMLVGVLLLLAGLFSSPQVSCFALCIEKNRPEFKGTTIAIVNMIVTLIGWAFQPVVGSIIDYFQTSHATCVNLSCAFRISMLTMPMITLVGAILACLITDKSKH